MGEELRTTTQAGAAGPRAAIMVCVRLDHEKFGWLDNAAHKVHWRGRPCGQRGRVCMSGQARASAHLAGATARTASALLRPTCGGH